jgi:hypothetical protein
VLSFAVAPVETIETQRAVPQEVAEGPELERGNDGFPIAPSRTKEKVMSKGQDAKKNVKKAPTKTPKEKKEAKRLKKAAKG